MTWFLSSEVYFATTTGFMAYAFGFAFGYQGSKKGFVILFQSQNLSDNLRRTILNPDWLPHTATGGERPGRAFVWKFFRYHSRPCADSARNFTSQYSNWSYNYSCQGCNSKRDIIYI